MSKRRPRRHSGTDPRTKCANANFIKADCPNEAMRTAVAVMDNGRYFYVYLCAPCKASLFGGG